MSPWRRRCSSGSGSGTSWPSPRASRPSLRRPAPDPRGHLGPGVRRPAAGRQAASGGPSCRSRRWITTSRPRTGPITDPLAKAQLDALRRNCEEFGVPLFATGSGREGIVHVIGPELGLTQPGMTIVCGDSHTSTHGAFGALAFGVGTSEVEHVLATQCLPQRRPRSMRVRFDGELPAERDGEGHDPRRDRPDRRGRRRRARDRVHRARRSAPSRWRTG